MAYSLDSLRDNPVPRFTDFVDGQEPKLFRKDQIPQGMLDHLDKNVDYLERIGVKIGPDRKVPKKHGVPRIFILKKDARGVERQVDLADAGIELNSREYWYQAQLGNIFAYPAGSTKPIQISAKFSGGYPDITYSRPIDPDKIPVAKSPENANHVYRKPSWFTRQLNKLFPRIRKRDCEIYNEQEALKKTFTDVSDLRGTGNRMDEELTDVLDEEEKLSGQKEKEQIVSAMESSQLSLQNKEVGKQLYRDHTAPKPVFHEEYLQGFQKDENYKAQNKHNHLLSLGSGYYTKEMFGDMKPIDNDFRKYVIGGEPVTQDEYCGLVAGCSMMPKYAYEAYKKSPEFDATALETYKNLGYSEEDAKTILSNYSATMIVTDHMKGDLRNSQANVFKNTISPAREEVFRVLEEYKNGNKEPLAKAIQRGIETAVCETQNHTNMFGVNIYNQAEFAEAALGLMDRDPDLKDLAVKNGLEEGDVQALRGMAAMSRAATAREKAKVAIAEGALGIKDLTEDEKRKYAEEIITANLMESKVYNENALQDKQGDAARKESERLMMQAAKDGLVLTADQIVEYKLHPEKRPMPPKGKLYADQVSIFVNGQHLKYNVHPDTMLELSDEQGVNDMKSLAASIVRREGLAKMDIGDLNKALVMNNDKYMGSNLIFKGEEAIYGSRQSKKQEPDRQKEAEDEYEALNTGVNYGYKAPKI